MTRPKLTCVPGDKFGHLTAIEPAPSDVGGNQRWVFACQCGRRVTWRVSTATSNLRKLGWASCGHCYRDAGGWEEIAARNAGAT